MSMISVVERSFDVSPGGSIAPADRHQPVASDTSVRLDIVDFNDQATVAWLHENGDLNREVVEALTADESRPRSAVFDDGLLVVMRGINRNADAQPEDMISIRVWMAPARIIIAQRRGLRSVNALVELLEQGLIEQGSTGIFLQLTDLLGDQIGDYVDEVEDKVVELDQRSESGVMKGQRKLVSELRRDVAAVRRYLYPQRDALNRLVRAPIGMFDSAFSRALAERADRITRYVEDLDLARERLMMLREEAAAQLAAEQNSRMYLLAIVTTIFLPLGFVTGLFGINVGGMPGVDNPAAFNIVLIGLAGLALVVALLLRWKKWF